MFCLLLLVACALADVTRDTVTLIDASRDNRSIPVLLAWTTKSSTDSNDQPLLAFGHGGYIEPEYYDYIADAVAASGLIWAAPNTSYTGLAIKDDLAQDLAFTVKAIRAGQLSQLSAGANSPTIISGHSGGADSAIVAAGKYLTASEDGLVGLAPMAPGDWLGGDFGMEASLAAVDDSVPLLLQGASPSRFFICGYGPHDSQIPLYNSATSKTCRAFVEVKGGNHCQYASGAGCTSCEGTFSLRECNDNKTIIPPQQQHSAILNLTLPWIHFALARGMGNWESFMSTTADNRTYGNVMADCNLTLVQ